MIVKTEQNEIQKYLIDAANITGFCESVYFPQNESEIIEIVEHANSTGTPVTIAGNLTGLTGGSVPQGGIVISTEKLNRIIEFNKSEKFVIVQPGILLADLQKVIEENGLYYPPDPTETNSFIGGNVATNASGAKSFKYGATRNFVQSLRIVLADGDILQLERNQFLAKDFRLSLRTESNREIMLELPKHKMPNVKNAAGFFTHSNVDAVDLFIGSEGTLGIITEIKLNLLNYPEGILSAVLFFPEEDKALDFIAEARECSYRTESGNNNGLSARGLEFFEENALNFMRADYPNIPGIASAAVWFEQETTPGSEEEMFEKWIDLAEKFSADTENSWMAMGVKDRQRFKDFRHVISQKVTDYISTHGFHKFGTDTAVPHERFKEFYFWSKELIRKNNINFINYGHFGDSHMHLNILPGSEEEFKRGAKLYNDICRKAIELKGTISAEHGIGKFKRKYLIWQYGEEVVLQMAKVKNALDPNGILNRGNVFSSELLNKADKY